jgi:hypothetical protein
VGDIAIELYGGDQGTFIEQDLTEQVFELLPAVPIWVMDGYCDICDVPASESTSETQLRIRGDLPLAFSGKTSTL